MHVLARVCFGNFSFSFFTFSFTRGRIPSGVYLLSGVHRTRSHYNSASFLLLLYHCCPSTEQRVCQEKTNEDAGREKGKKRGLIACVCVALSTREIVSGRCSRMSSSPNVYIYIGRERYRCVLYTQKKKKNWSMQCRGYPSRAA